MVCAMCHMRPSATTTLLSKVESPPTVDTGAPLQQVPKRQFQGHTAQVAVPKWGSHPAVTAKSVVGSTTPNMYRPLAPVWCLSGT